MQVRSLSRKLSRLKKAQLTEIVQHYEIDEVEGYFRKTELINELLLYFGVPDVIAEMAREDMRKEREAIRKSKEQELENEYVRLELERDQVNQLNRQQQREHEVRSVLSEVSVLKLCLDLMLMQLMYFFEHLRGLLQKEIGCNLSG